jgi:hypothetical protein
LRPFEQRARLDLKKRAEPIQGLGVEPAELTTGPGETVCARITELRTSTEGVRRDPALPHQAV